MCLADLPSAGRGPSSRSPGAALAIVKLVVPGLPTTPFVLLAAWAASRAVLFTGVATFVVMRPKPNASR